MQFDRRGFLRRLGTVAALAGVDSPITWAQGFPTRPLRLVVPYAPGGPTDIIARLIAQSLSDQLGKPVVVENVPGASGNIGMARGAKAAADGHTLLIVPPNIVVNPALYDTIPYDPYRDFDAVTIAVTSPVVLAIHPSIGARSVKELVARIEASPSRFSFASPGIGTPPHLVGEQFRLSLGLDLAHVPFNSAGQAVNSALAGHTPIVFTSAPPAVPHVTAGRLIALAIASSTRSAALAGVPTMAEVGYPEIAGEGWFAFVVPSGTPESVTAVLHREIVKALVQQEVNERITKLGFELVGSTPRQAAAQFRAEGGRWTKLIKAARIKLD